MVLSAKNTRLRDILCRRQKTKSEGKVDMVFGMFLLLLVALVVMYESRLQAVRMAGDTVEDALAGALLAAAVIDVEKYGRTGEVCVADAVGAYGMFTDALRHNLQLTTSDYSTNDDLLYGKVELTDFRIYHVVGEDVTEQSVVVGSSLPPYVIGKKGEAKTPDGVTIENTTLYGKVSFHIKGLFYEELSGEKEKSVDIVRSKEIENEKE